MQRRDFLKLTAAVGMASALPLWSRAVFAASRPALPIPSLLAADARNRIALRIQAGKTRFGALNATTWGYNGSLLGPALQLTQGKTVTVDITNQLAEETTLHWHGLEVPGEVDGGATGGYRAGRHPHGKLHANAAGGDLLVSSASAWEHRPAGGDGAGRPGADRG